MMLQAIHASSDSVSHTTVSESVSEKGFDAEWGTIEPDAIHNRGMKACRLCYFKYKGGPDMIRVHLLPEIKPLDR